MKFSCISSFLILILVPAVVMSEPDVSDKKITILRAGDWAPYHYVENNQLKGNLIQLIRKASEISGIEAEFKTVPNWNRCLRLMKLGMVDAFFPIFKNDERETYMIFHENGILDYEKDYIVTSSTQKIDFSGDLKALKDYRIGVTKGYFYGKAFENADYLQKIPSRNEEKLLDLLFADNRYDMIIGDRKVITSIVSKKNKLDKIRFLEPPVVNEPLYMAFNKKIKAVRLKRFTDAIVKARQRLKKNK